MMKAPFLTTCLGKNLHILPTFQLDALVSSPHGELIKLGRGRGGGGKGGSIYSYVEACQHASLLGY